MNKTDAQQWLKKFELDVFPQPEIIQLKHPVLICHGYGAIVSLLKPSPLHDVALLMRSYGVVAFAPNIVPYATIETRAREWVEVLHQLSQQTGFKKFNLVAHSMGGLDMRYALCHLDIADKIESFTTVSTPHRGSYLAELVLKTPEPIRDKLADLLDWVGEHLYPKTHSNSEGAAKQLTRQYVTEVFNPNTLDLEDIPYYSFSAAAGKNTQVPISTLLKAQNRAIYDKEGVNDGFVSVGSAKWGLHIATGELSHLEQMNMQIEDKRKPVFRHFWKQVLSHLSEKNH